MANTPAKKITYDNKPVQVESAIRDGSGLEIATNYAKKTDIPSISITGGSAETGKYISQITASGHTLTVTKGSIPTATIASADTLGSIKVGTNLSINSTTGVLSATNTTYSNGPGLSVSGTTFRETFPVYYARPNETTATATLTVTISNFPSAYADGIMIALRMPFANSASSTLNVNGLGAKPVYFNNNSTTASRWAAANTVQMLVYETTTVSTGCWKAVYAYDSNNTTTCRQTTLGGSDNVNRSLLLSYVVNTTTGNTDNITYRSTKIYANDSTGTVTATKFVGALQGNVTGNCSGSSGSCTGNAATATALTSGNKNISGNLTVTGELLDQRDEPFISGRSTRNLTFASTTSAWTCVGRHWFTLNNGSWLGGLEAVVEGSIRYIQFALNTSRTVGEDHWGSVFRIRSDQQGSSYLEFTGDIVLDNGCNLKFGTSGDGIGHNTSPQYLICTSGSSTSGGVAWCNVSELPTKGWNTACSWGNYTSTFTMSSSVSGAKEILVVACTSNENVGYAATINAGDSVNVQIVTDDGTSTSYCINVQVSGNTCTIYNNWHSKVKCVYYR